MTNRPLDSNSSFAELDLLTDDELWDVAADSSHHPDMRFEAMRRWLYPNSDRPDGNDGSRLEEVRRRATRLERDEIEEDDIEDIQPMLDQGLFFDGAGRLILEVNGERYLIDD
jgi:hypothetical protein